MPETKVNLDRLNSKIEDSGLKLTYLAAKLGLSRYGFYLKRIGQSEYTASEINALCQLLRIDSIDERSEIFFYKNS